MIWKLGIAGGLAMVALEAAAVTHIGYWWALVPVVLGFGFQPMRSKDGKKFTVIGSLAEIFSLFD